MLSVDAPVATSLGVNQAQLASEQQQLSLAVVSTEVRYRSPRTT